MFGFFRCWCKEEAKEAISSLWKGVKHALLEIKLGKNSRETLKLKEVCITKILIVLVLLSIQEWTHLFS